MKIIYLHQYFRKPTMSGGIRSYELARRLVRDGHEVILVTADTENCFDSWRVEHIDGIEVHWISVKYDNSFGFFRRILAFLKFLILATIHILPINADKIIATSTPLTISIPGIFYKIFRRKPFIFEVRDVWPEVPIALGFLNNAMLKQMALVLEKITYSFSSVIIALSPDMRTSISKRCNNKRIAVIPNASDVDLFDNSTGKDVIGFSEDLRLIRKKHEKVLFYTGTLGMVNNLKYLIELSSYSDGSVAFVIIGSGKEKQELIEMASDLSVLDNVIYFFDAVPKQHLYIIHDLFDMACSTVLPINELYANSANKIFDAFASGTPILINHGGWISELINETSCGVELGIVPNQYEFNKLHSFIFDEKLMEKAKVSSKNLGLNDFNRENLYRAFLDVVEGAK